MSEIGPNTGESEVRLATVDQIIARVQSLCDTPRAEGGYPLATHVEGYFLGDVTAIVAAAIRSERLLERVNDGSSTMP